MESEYSSNVVRVLHPTATPTTNNNWEDKHYESKSTRKILDSTSDHQLASTNFIRQAQSNYSTRSNYSTKSNREYMDDELLRHQSAPSHQQKIITTTTTTRSSKNHPNGRVTPSGNVNYLDELLDDLKNERTSTSNLDLQNEYNTISSSYKYNNSSSSNIPDSSSKLNKHHRTEYIDSKLHRSNIDNSVYNTTTKSSSSGSLMEHNPRTGTTIKRTEHIEVLPQNVGGSTVQRSKHVEILNSKNLESIPQRNINETTIKRNVVIDNTASELNELPLNSGISEDLLPLPGTKVTTTVRTYTYEVPSVGTRTNVLYHDDKRDSSTINRNYTENITNINDNYSTTKTTKHITNGNVPPLNENTPLAPYIDEPDSTAPGPKRTYYYKHEVHNTKNTINQPPPPQPYINEYHVTKNTTNTTTTNRYPPNGIDSPPPHSLRPISPESVSPAPPPSVSHHTYVTKSTTTNNYIDGPHGPHGPHGPTRQSPYDGSLVGRPPYDGNSPRPHSPGPVRQTYMRSHEKTTSTTMPFPVTDTGYPPNDDRVHPPKNVDDLMATFDRNGDGIDSDEIRRKREIDTSIANTDNKVRVPSRNQSGPPVFYPPNSELTLRKEEGGGAWKAQGGYAAGASGYEYQAESSSKSKSKSGAAVVPVCLPLCCAMPCVIM